MNSQCIHHHVTQIILLLSVARDGRQINALFWKSLRFNSYFVTLP
jgi:hypothetical protein